MNNLRNNQAISSVDIYGGEDYEEAGTFSKLKDMAWGFTQKAAEKAKEVKDKTSVYINNIQNKYGNK